MEAFRRLFGRPTAAVIGVIHVPALPGTPKNKDSISNIIKHACNEAKIYKDSNVMKEDYLQKIIVLRTPANLSALIEEVNKSRISYGNLSVDFDYTSVSKVLILDSIRTTVKSSYQQIWIRCGSVHCLSKRMQIQKFLRFLHTTDAIMIENMHDIPYLHSEKVGPEITAFMAVIGAEVKKIFGRPVGVQILAAANTQALAVAKAAELDFIRAECFVFSHVADEGLMDSCAGSLLRYRKQIGADGISIFTDIKKKHSAHAITADVDIAETAKAAEFFLSNGVIVTGTFSGEPVNTSDLYAVQKAVNIPVLVGSGITLNNLPDFLSANALIVGSHFKKEGKWYNEIDPLKVSSFMEKVIKSRQFTL